MPSGDGGDSFSNPLEGFGDWLGNLFGSDTSYDNTGYATSSSYGPEQQAIAAGGGNPFYTPPDLSGFESQPFGGSDPGVTSVAPPFDFGFGSGVGGGGGFGSVGGDPPFTPPIDPGPPPVDPGPPPAPPAPPVFSFPGVSSYGGWQSGMLSDAATTPASVPTGSFDNPLGTSAAPVSAGQSAATTAAPAAAAGGAYDWTSLADTGYDGSADAVPTGMGGGLSPADRSDKTLAAGGKSNSALDLARLAAGVGGLGYAMYKGQQDLPSTGALKDQLAYNQGQADKLSARGEQMIAEGRTAAEPLRQRGEQLITEGRDAARPLQTQGQQMITDSQTAARPFQERGQQIIDAGIQRQGQFDEMGRPIISQGSDYTKFLASGTLPPEMQTKLDNDIKGAKAALMSRYASQGMPTDPLRNSSLQAELKMIDDQGREMAGKLGQQLLQSGQGLIGTGAGLMGQGTQAAASAGGTGLGLINAGTNVSSSMANTGGGLINSGTNLQSSMANTGGGLINSGTQLQSSMAGTGGGLVGTGAQMTGMSNSLLTTLSNIDQTQTQNIGKAISNFTNALGSMGRQPAPAARATV